MTLLFRLSLLLIALSLASCIYEERYGYYDDYHGPYYGADYDPGVDFYYVRRRPYSREYGPLRYRDGRYFYSRGGRYVIYDRPTVVHRHSIRRDWDRDDDDDDDGRERWRERRRRVFFW
jgi:hypothetical protein